MQSSVSFGILFVKIDIYPVGHEFKSTRTIHLKSYMEWCHLLIVLAVHIESFLPQVYQWDYFIIFYTYMSDWPSISIDAVHISSIFLEQLDDLEIPRLHSQLQRSFLFIILWFVVDPLFGLLPCLVHQGGVFGWLS